MHKSVSPTRTYMAMCSKLTNEGYTGYIFKKFVLPEKDLGMSGEQMMVLANNSETASWYYLNRLDKFSYIEGCLSFEDYISAFPDQRKDILVQLVEAQKLLKNIQQDVLNGQISDISKDIEEFFEKYPFYKRLEETKE